MNELVSAIITTYKREPEVVSEAIDSVLKQTYSPIEIIVVDDNSNNSPESIALKKHITENYPTVHYVKQDGNKGAQAARNLGMLVASGIYLGYLDDDDEWLPNKIQLQVEKFHNHGDDVALVYGTGKMVNYNTKPKTVSDYFNYNKIKGILTFEDLLMEDRIGSTSMPLIRKSSLNDVGGFDEKLPARQDYETWIRIAQKYSIVGINEELFIHKIHAGEQISKDPYKAYHGYMYIYKEFKTYYDNSFPLMYAIESKIFNSAKRARIWGFEGAELIMKHFMIKVRRYVRCKIGRKV